MYKLKEIRKSMGYTQLYMAKKLNISESYYSQLENGNRRMPLSIALKIAKVLNKSFEDIFLP
ncbi:helix-turn-helix transcriptional regulator [Thermoanaerobacterium saccharolyticum]|uniref:DNA-binding XRE family transcriptional regulator n=1 Tax=Thermoanaerobacterium butyriciformans TaxID=1702242 RepID=A0ABS4NCJ3_9THEO|nr:helix-turn-helix transcriptional regulator [Thermoanaerobacterium butyriciformans]MBP2071371.1 DNA-binding XRE family transcriptional regulator [Thermoanaerobacterium butyriciformans]